MIGSRPGGTRKLQRIAEKQVAKDQAHQEFLDGLSEAQLKRAFRNICAGTGSNEDKIHVAEHRALQGDFYAAEIFRRLVDPESMVIDRPEFRLGISHPNDEIPLSLEEQGARGD